MCEVRQGLQGMGCSKLLAEGGKGHTNFELPEGLFDRGYTKIWKSSVKVSKNRRGRGRETLYFYSFIYLFTFRATAFFSIVRTDIILTPNPNPRGHWPRKGVWGCAALKTPFSCLSCSQGSLSSKRVSSHMTPFWEDFEISASTVSIFTQNLAHKPPNVEIFSSQAPLFRGKYQFASPILQKSGPHTPTWKKSWVPPPPGP